MNAEDLILKIGYCFLGVTAVAMIVLAENWAEILAWTLIGICSSINLIKKT